MSAVTAQDPRTVIDRLTRAQNAHDLDGMLACFAQDYRSEQPVYPARRFQGIDQVRKNWSGILGGIRDFHSNVLRTAVDGDAVWAEMHWSGVKSDGSPFDQMMVTILGIRDGRIAWGRLYGGEVEREGAGIDASVRRMTGADEG